MTDIKPGDVRLITVRAERTKHAAWGVGLAYVPDRLVVSVEPIPWEPKAGEWALDPDNTRWWIFDGPNELMGLCQSYPRKSVLARRAVPVAELIGPLRPSSDGDKETE